MSHDFLYNSEAMQPVGLRQELSALKKLLPFLLEYKGRVALAIAFLVLVKAANVTVPFALKYIVESLDRSGLDEQQLQLIALPVSLLVAYGILRLSVVIFGELRDVVFGLVTERAMHKVGLAVFQHLHALDLEFHLSRRTGGLSRDIERGTNGISFLMRFLAFNIVPTLLEVALVTVLLFVNYNVWFALIILISVVSYISFSVIVTEWRTRYVREANLADNRANTRAIDSLLNYETVKYFGNEEFEASQYDVNLDAWEQARRKNRLSLATLNCGQAAIIAVGMTSMMVLAAYYVVEGTMSLGDLVLINAFSIQVFMPLNFLGMVYREMKRSLADIEKMMQLLATESRVQDKPQAKRLDLAGGSALQGIEFKNVNFSYGGDRPILKNLSFSLAPGKKLAIVGPSGAGKSTVAKLLFRFYDVGEGSILFNGEDIRNYSQSSLRANIGVVPQDTVLFNDTLFHNIAYGDPGATDQQVKRAAQLAHLSAFIDQLPKGYDTVAGERGLKVSGGEKQRIAIARALLKQPAIMVFDEATSSLDSVAEAAILTALNEVASNTTTLVIAHRLSTIIDADEIIVLDQGVLVQQGTHQQLLAQPGLYKTLWEIQQEETVQ